MTAFDIYLVMQLDSIAKATTLIAILLALFALFWIPVLDSIYDKEPLFKWMKIHAAAFTVFCLLSIFVPSSKTVAMMYVIPAIANNEKIQTEASEIYNLAKDGLKKLATDK